jgi:Zn finger protein HypA/HybF involved in hydrogenase expression
MDDWAGLGTIDPVSEKKPVGLSPVYPGKVRCLGCERQFESPSKRHVRLCPKCRGRK